MIAITRGLGFAALAVLILGCPAARADSILLRGGERLIGRVLVEEEGKIQFESQTLGVMVIPRDRIERIERDAPPPPPERVAAAEPIAKEKDVIGPVPPPETAASPVAPPAGKAPESTTSPTVVAIESSVVDESIMPAPPVELPSVPKTADAPKESAGPVPLPVNPPVAPVAVAAGKDAAESLRTPVAPAASAVPVVVSTQTAPAAEGSPAPAPAPVFYPWSGLRTEQDTFDWIQLKSGEWLKGTVKSMQDEKLEFDSEEMDFREIDWKDITMLRSPRLNSVWFDQTGTADGSLLITPTEVRVVSKSGTNTYPRSDLLAITHAGDKERQKWSGEVSLGFNVRTGNAEEASYNAHVNLQRRTPNTRLILDYLGNYTRSNEVITADNLRQTATFDYFLSRKLYIRVPDAEYYSDALQNIANRLTLGASVGYDIMRTRKVEWDVSAGPAYQILTYDSVEPGASPEEKSVTMVISTHLEYQLTKRIDWTLDYRGQFNGKDSAGSNTQHVNSTLEFDIHKRLNLDISAIWDRVGSPKTDTGGTTPTSDDFRLITSLGIDF